MTRLTPDEQFARNLRKTFTQKDAKEEYRLNANWPSKMSCIGTCEAIAYASDKWRDDGKLIEYKHVSEGPQLLFVSDKMDVPYDLFGPDCEMPEGMPMHVAELAPILFIESNLYVDEDEEGEGVLEENYTRLILTNSVLYSGRNTKTKEPFLVVVSSGVGVSFLVTGDELDVTVDGITG